VADFLTELITALRGLALFALAVLALSIGGIGVVRLVEAAIQLLKGPDFR
jgi:hypothetical protein